MRKKESGWKNHRLKGRGLRFLALFPPLTEQIKRDIMKKKSTVVGKVAKMESVKHEGAKVYIYTRVSTDKQVDGYSRIRMRENPVRVFREDRAFSR